MDKIYYHGYGKSLQQLSMFLVEQCFHQKYVGFIDTDTMFVTSVTPELMFNGTKPIMFGLYGFPFFRYWQGTLLALQKKEVFNFMDYFPVVIKVEHIINLRKHLEKIHGMPFLDVFAKISKGSYSQFSIMGNYLWYYHREEYQFSAQFRVDPKKSWRQNNQVNGREDALYYDKHLTNDMKFPMPRTSLHSKEQLRWLEKPDGQRRLLHEGICHSGGFQLCADLCKNFTKSALHKDLFIFHRIVNWTWDSGCIQAQNHHYWNLETHYRNESLPRILRGCEDIRHNRVPQFRKTHLEPHLPAKLSSNDLKLRRRQGPMRFTLHWCIPLNKMFSEFLGQSDVDCTKKTLSPSVRHWTSAVNSFPLVHCNICPNAAHIQHMGHIIGFVLFE